MLPGLKGHLSDTRNDKIFLCLNVAGQLPSHDLGGMSIQLANQIKFGSCSFRSIEHESLHAISIQNSSLVDKHERTAYYIIIQINVT